MPNYRVEDDDKIWWVIALVLGLALIGLVEGVIWIVEFIKYLLTILDVYFNIS